MGVYILPCRIKIRILPINDVFFTRMSHRNLGWLGLDRCNLMYMTIAIRATVVIRPTIIPAGNSGTTEVPVIVIS